MSREVVLRIQPGESVDAFTSRIAAAAPPLTPQLADRLRSLLAIDTEPPAERAAPAQAPRAKAA
ncbi:hypothetical protein [Streptomyces sp. KR55]|uniref:hypothetical protein n=1 Tax=Streptomyces sp. KR55 TaxID=3457425 RepID=UPI003FD42735